MVGLRRLRANSRAEARKRVERKRVDRIVLLKTPLAADYPGADTRNWTSRPRPTITAWKGADMDAYYLDDAAAWIWRHCQTGEVWHA